MKKILSSIDLGTNTCLLTVLASDHIKPIDDFSKLDHPDFFSHHLPVIHDVLHDEATVVRLGEGLKKNKRFLHDAKERTLLTLQKYEKTLRALQGDPKETVCIATASARDAEDAKEFFLEVEKKTGFRFQIISGEIEAKLSFYGIFTHPKLSSTRSSPLGSLSVLDIGGGSTEVRNGEGFLVSFPIGSVKLSEMFFSESEKPTQKQRWDAEDYLDSLFLEKGKNIINIQNQRIFGVAGTVTTLASYFLRTSFDPAKIEGLNLTKSDIHRIASELSFLTKNQIKNLPGISSGREDVIFSGSLILWRLLESFGFSQLEVSTRGLRYGVFFQS